MPLTIGALESLEQALADAISADGALAGIAVHVDPQKNIVAEVTNKISKLGTLIMPYVPRADDDSSGIDGVFYDNVRFTVSVFQNPKLVANGLSARNIAERICAILKGNPLWPRNIHLLKPTIEHIADAQLNIYQVNGETAVDGNILPKLPDLTSAVAAGNVTLGCARPGAAIFYRTDGIQPTTSDTLYTAPFASAAQTITARAWLAGFLASTPLTLQT
jgi:hypothetical protein